MNEIINVSDPLAVGKLSSILQNVKLNLTIRLVHEELSKLIFFCRPSYSCYLIVWNLTFQSNIYL